MENIKKDTIHESMHEDQCAVVEDIKLVEDLITDDFKDRVNQLMSEYADVMEALS